MSKEKLRVAIYCRTLSDESKYSIDYQEESIRKRLKNNDNIQSIKVYKDFG